MTKPPSRSPKTIMSGEGRQRDVRRQAGRCQDRRSNRRRSSNLPRATRRTRPDAKSETPAGESVTTENAKPEAAKVETAGVADVKSDAAKSEMPKAIDKPEDKPRNRSRRPDAGAVTPDVPKDQARPSDPEKAAAPKPAVAGSAQAQRPDRRVRQPKGRQALCAAEFRAAVRRAGDDRAKRPPARNPCLHGADRQGRRQSAALVGGLDAGRGARRRGWTTTSARRGAERRPARSK